MSGMPSILGEGRRRSIACLAFFALGQAAAAGVAAFATRDVFAALRDGVESLPLWPMISLVLSGMAIAALRVAERVIAERVGQGYAASLRLTLFKHLTEMSARDVAGKRSGGLAMRFVGDLAAVRGWVSLGLARGISAAIVLPVACGLVFLLDPALGTAAAVPLAIGLLVMLLAGPRLGPAHRRLRSRRARLAADMTERIPSAPELRLLGRIGTEERNLLRRTRAMVSAALERARHAALLRAVPDVVSGLAAAAVLLVAFRSGGSAARGRGSLGGRRLDGPADA